ncbi:RraA family protein [Jidongwangia harbinensis]|uniref:RraA family protein n=1 Tax=Jidongwangia harbinensis TaxID=2878561 RepID=UPI001CD91E0D|nr:4-carboxy-4-hydroxy-2-oxoadipate aldolase/oxaloacetate decarboxylase [Jidongwangia harbinensis]MCA2212200.1 4-carboxy-4-hydroxy-2-oxoadipate aldolase/oxaloacetate decarboxylase [Jidongwangia harbinensis]
MTAGHQDLAAAGVATVYEAAGRRGLLDTDLEQLVPGSRVAGPARTVRCGQDDNRAVHEAMTRLRPGEILVLTMPRPAPVALIGELLATQAQVRGAAGILVDAAVRDVDDLRRLGLPVWARWRRVRGAAKDVRGELDVPVRVGGATIAPGDIVILDADGGVVVPPETVDQVAVAVAARLDREATMRARLAAGELSYDIHGLRTADEVGS